MDFNNHIIMTYCESLDEGLLGSFKDKHREMVKKYKADMNNRALLALYRKHHGGHVPPELVKNTPNEVFRELARSHDSDDRILAAKYAPPEIKVSLSHDLSTDVKSALASSSPDLHRELVSDNSPRVRYSVAISSSDAHVLKKLVGDIHPKVALAAFKHSQSDDKLTPEEKSIVRDEFVKKHPKGIEEKGFDF